MEFLILIGAGLLALLHKSIASTSGPGTVVSQGGPTLGTAPQNSNEPVATLSREPTLGTWQDWQNGPVTPVSPGAAGDFKAPLTATSENLLNQLSNLALYLSQLSGGAPQVINPVTGESSGGGTTSSGGAATGGDAGAGSAGSASQGGGFSCPIEGTEIVVLGGSSMSAPLVDEMEWVIVETQNGKKLSASLSHLLYTRRGLVRLFTVTTEDHLVTDEGESRVSQVRRETRPGRKMHIHIPDGHLYWANGVLSHNNKAQEAPI